MSDFTDLLFHPIGVFDGSLKRQREIFVVFGEINFGFYPGLAVLCLPPQFEHKSVSFLQFLFHNRVQHISRIFVGLLQSFDRWEPNSWHLVQRKDVDSKYSLILNCFPSILKF